MLVPFPCFRQGIHKQVFVSCTYSLIPSDILLIGEDALAEKIADIIISQGPNSFD